MSRRHANILERLQPIAGRLFSIQITDLGVALLLTVHSHAVAVKVVRQAPPCDVGIEGTLSVLFALLEGDLDGDSLFFSRDLQVDGDTEALLTLRNALDSEDFSLKRELLNISGPIIPAAQRIFEALAPAHPGALKSGGRP
nr:SCP2 sterol-binding domain-containing protein [Kordiimonas lipolytica]